MTKAPILVLLFFGASCASSSPRPTSSSPAADGDIPLTHAREHSSYIASKRLPRRIAGLARPEIPAPLKDSLFGKRGVTIARVFINENGEVDDAIIAQTTIPELNAVVIEFLRAWRFEPPTIDGALAKISVLQPFAFSFF